MALRSSVLVALVSFALFGSSPAQALPPRVRVIVHGSHELIKDKLTLSGDLIPGPNLIHGLAPLAHVVLEWKVAPWLTLGPNVGFDFAANEVIAALQISLSSMNEQSTWRNSFWSWADFEIQPQSKSLYWFAQGEWQPNKLLALGIEEESWGTTDDFARASHGGGPNVLLRLGGFQFDIAAHYRDTPGIPPTFFTPAVPGQKGAELFVRAHIWL